MVLANGRLDESHDLSSYDDLQWLIANCESLSASRRLLL